MGAPGAGRPAFEQFAAQGAISAEKPKPATESTPEASQTHQTATQPIAPIEKEVSGSAPANKQEGGKGQACEVRRRRNHGTRASFQAGFPTAQAVTDVSGRGVGMGVVKRSIEKLRGTVGLDSQLGRRTTISIRLPMTLAIIEGLSVGVQDGRYVMSLSNVEECIELTFEEGEDQEQAERGRNGNHLVKIHGDLVPYIRLRDWFEVGGDQPSIEQIVVVRQGEQRMGFCIDEVIGQQQTVIKGLGKAYQDVQDSFAGATIMGDGSVAMIIDINQNEEGRSKYLCSQSNFDVFRANPSSEACIGFGIRA